MYLVVGVSESSTFMTRLISVTGIKIENEPENDENEPNDGKSENTRIDVQKTNNENCKFYRKLQRYVYI